MAGFFDNILDKMRLQQDTDDDELDNYDAEEDDEDDFEEPEEKKVTKRPRFLGGKSDDEQEVADQKPEPVAKPKPVIQKASSNNRVVRYKGGMEVCVIRPSNIEDGRDISDTLLEGKPVILNMEGIDVNLAQRIIDFTSGACYSIRGNLQKISNYIFIVTPESIDISGDFQELVSGNDLGFKSGSLY